MAAVWQITDHLCRRPVEDGGFCGGRIVSKLLDTGRLFFRCTRCGIEAVGSAKALCACGETVHNGKFGGSDAGLRCVKNPARSNECPDELVIRYVEPMPREVAQKSKVVTRYAGES